MTRDGVPVIDMQSTEALPEEIVKACEEWGIFRIINHGIAVELLAEMQAVVALLFDLPEDIKRQTVSAEGGKGYIKFKPSSPYLEGFSIDDVSSRADFCDRLHVSPQQREIINRYTEAVCDLAKRIGGNLMEGFGLAGDLFEGWSYQMRFNKYHFCPESVGSCGVFAHSDPSFLTILLDDEAVRGLQIVDKYTGEIAPVDPCPGTIAVNIGDIGKAWSNGRFYNVKHRVWCVEPKIRSSTALFVLGPNNNHKVQAPPELVDSQHPRLYVPFDIKEYRIARYANGLQTGGALELFSATETGNVR